MATHSGVKALFLPFFRALGVNGLDPKAGLRALVNFPRFFRDIVRYRRMTNLHPSFRIGFINLYPCFSDYTDKAGGAKGHYFHQDLHIARKIFKRRPARHVDIGSRVDGFVAHLLTFMPVEVVDIRPIKSQVAGLSFLQGDATMLKGFSDDSLDSISTLHAAEHFGLGRYGDPINPEAPFAYMKSLSRVLAPGGRLYFSVPVGRERLEFNAHRIFAPQTILDVFQELTLISFAAVLDDGDLYTSVAPTICNDSSMACGIFEFTK
jgi:hypothetical protein